MTEIDNDKLLRDFFAENKQEIADNGFSRRVMHHLPGRSNRLARIWSAFVMLSLIHISDRWCLCLGDSNRGSQHSGYHRFHLFIRYCYP